MTIDCGFDGGESSGASPDSVHSFLRRRILFAVPNKPNPSKKSVAGSGISATPAIPPILGCLRSVNPPDAVMVTELNKVPSAPKMVRKFWPLPRAYENEKVSLLAVVTSTVAVPLPKNGLTMRLLKTPPGIEIVTLLRRPSEDSTRACPPDGITRTSVVEPKLTCRPA